MRNTDSRIRVDIEKQRECREIIKEVGGRESGQQRPHTLTISSLPAFWGAAAVVPVVFLKVLPCFTRGGTPVWETNKIEDSKKSQTRGWCV